MYTLYIPLSASELIHKVCIIINCVVINRVVQCVCNFVSYAEYFIHVLELL